MIVSNANQLQSTQKEKRRIRHPTSLTIQPLIYTKDLLVEAKPAKRKSTFCLQHTGQRLHLLMSQKKLENCIMMQHHIHCPLEQLDQIYISIIFLLIQLLVHASTLILLLDFLMAVCKSSLVMNKFFHVFLLILFLLVNLHFLLALHLFVLSNDQ